MALSMREEAAYEDELIDEFDAPDALLSDQRESLSHTLQYRQQQLSPSPPPLVSAQSLQYQPSLTSAPVASAPEPAVPEPAAPWETMRLAGALYPSFEELNGSGGSDGGGGGARRASGSGAPFSTPSVASPYGAVATQSPPRPPPLPPAQQQHSKVQYPSMELGSEQIGPRRRNWSRDHEYSTIQTLHRTQDSDTPVKQNPPVQSRTPHRAEAAEKSESFRPPADPSPEHQQQGEPVAPVEDEPETLPMLSKHEFEVKQKEIAQELRGYEQQLDYLAHALAGDTPHQKEERKRRELERREREHQRLVAMESRVQHQIERAHDREVRRAKVLERARRASRSSSPDMRREDEKSRGEEREEEENVEPQKDTFKANFVE